MFRLIKTIFAGFLFGIYDCLRTFVFILKIHRSLAPPPSPHTHSTPRSKLAPSKTKHQGGAKPASSHRWTYSGAVPSHYSSSINRENHLRQKEASVTRAHYSPPKTALSSSSPPANCSALSLSASILSPSSSSSSAGSNSPGDVSILTSLSKICVWNGALYLTAAVIYYSCTKFWTFFLPIASNIAPVSLLHAISKLCSLFFDFTWRVIIMILMEIVNIVHLKNVTSKINRMREDMEATVTRLTAHSTALSSNAEHKSSVTSSTLTSTTTTTTGMTATTLTKTSSHSIGHQFLYRMFIGLVLVFFLLQMNIVASLCSSIKCVADFAIFLHYSFLFAFYSMEYRWSHEGVHFDVRLHRVVSCAPYFLGFGAPLGILQIFSFSHDLQDHNSLHSLSSLLCTLLYPFLVAGAYQIRWSHRQSLSDLTPHSTFLVHLFRALFQPSIFLTNQILRLLGIGATALIPALMKAASASR